MIVNQISEVCKQNCYTKEQNLVMTSKTTLIRYWYEL